MTDSATLRRSAKYPREDKVATVKEIKELFTNSRASVFTEYRGLTVAQLKELRDRLRESDATYKVYKNTLVRIAAKEAGLSIDDTLVGPVAIAFANSDAVSAAKALNDFSVANKVLLAQIAGTIQSPLTKSAGLFQAFTRNAAYAFKALADKKSADEAA